MKHMSIVIASLLCMSTANATVWYVHPDSAMDCIEYALDSCSTGDTVLVGPGIYSEHITWPSTQGIDLVSQYGVDMTYINGSHTGIVIEISTGVDSSTIVSGFTIQDGLTAGFYCNQNSSPTITGNTITGTTCSDHGGGIYCYLNSSPTISGNTVTGNNGMWGGGIECNGSSPVINNNTITGNTAYRGGGISCYYSSSPIITDNTITQDTAHWTGGGIWCTVDCSPTISGNTISDNIVDGGSSQDVGGGICCMYNSSPTITDNTISNNSATAGGGILCYENSSPSITNNTITGNAGTAGGGGILVYENGCAPTITDNTLTYNTADGGGGLVLQTTLSLVTNNLITNNTATFGGGIHCTVDDSSKITGNTITDNTANTGGGISCKLGASPTIRHCIIEGNYGDGIYCFENANPIIDSNNIIDNMGYGIRNMSSITINAEDNWWGHATGPYHPTANPSGSGDTVSNYVDFNPWLTSPGIEEYTSSPPVKLHLQVTPNPFLKLTQIRYSILDTRYSIQEPTMRIYDASGRMVKSFDLGSSIQDPVSAFVWHGDDNAGRKLPAGTYFINLVADESASWEKVILIH